ncbi:hypothetical protein [Streptomyces sp. H51]|uniref:hypothetical protein n=1 Tax=Streptomyces sp. H51 TaxID=3111770 RepID=UPI002D772D9E|nr:hypothetical protein [Streptomyces sp. H51]
MRRGSSEPGPPGRRAAAALVWWCALFPLWFLFTGQFDVLTALWAAGAACAAAAGAVLVTGRLSAGRPRLRWVAGLPRAARQTVLDFGVVTAVLVRSVATGRRGPVGRFVRRQAPAAGRGPAAAWPTLLATYSPNAYVLDVDPDSGRVLLHDLCPRGKSEEPL